MSESTNDVSAKGIDPSPRVLPTRPVVLTKPRVWPVFVSFVLMILAIFASQIAVAVALVVHHSATGGDMAALQQSLVERMSHPAMFIGANALVQLMIGAAAVVPAILSPRPWRERLGLVTPNMPTWAWPVVVLGAFFPLAIGLGLAFSLAEVLSPDPTVGQLYDQMTPAFAVPFVLFIGLAPGFMEELFFRGYMQRRLLQRWSPWVAIGVTSILFGILHLAPHAVVAAFPIGVWIGVIAWRTKSVWPGIVCHATINASWNTLNLAGTLGGMPDAIRTAIMAATAAAGLVCFVVSIWIFRRDLDRPTVPGGS